MIEAMLPPKVRHLWRHFWLLAKPYWASSEKWPAFGLLALVIGLSLGMVFMNVQFNSWYNEFYDTLQKLDAAGFYDDNEVERVAAADHGAGKILAQRERLVEGGERPVGLGCMGLSYAYGTAIDKPAVSSLPLQATS